MENKVLVKFIFPDYDVSYDAFIPVNEIIWKIKKLVIKSISDLINCPIDFEKNYVFINKNNSRIYNNNEIIINTDIRNGSELLIILGEV